MLKGRYKLLVEVPSAEEYRNLRVLEGLSAKSTEGAAIGLPNSFLGVVVRLDGELVGMGRVVGDGGLAFQLVDIAVHPEHQRKGLGQAIVSSLLERLEKVAPIGAHISLLADGPARFLYTQFGFQPTAPSSVGMELPVRYVDAPAV